MSRVFVVNEPAKRDGSRTMDLTPATEFGELVFLAPAGDVPLDLRPSVEMLREGLASFTAEDYLLPVGHPMLIAAAGALAAQASGGRVRMLLWRGGLGRYVPVSADLGEKP